MILASIAVIELPAITTAKAQNMTTTTTGAAAATAAQNQPKLHQQQQQILQLKKLQYQQWTLYQVIKCIRQ